MAFVSSVVPGAIPETARMSKESQENSGHQTVTQTPSLDSKGYTDGQEKARTEGHFQSHASPSTAELQRALRGQKRRLESAAAPAEGQPSQEQHLGESREKMEQVFGKVVVPHGQHRKERKAVIREELLKLEKPLRLTLFDKEPIIDKDKQTVLRWRGLCATCQSRVKDETSHCTTTAWVYWTASGPYENFLRIMTKGRCGAVKAADGHMLFTAEEQAAVQRAVEGATKTTCSTLRQECKKSGVKLRCDPRQLS
eukprot:1538271-Karenia_brevis.AAC.1